jgi:tetratricopeptide (TPR) repeat protein
MQLSSLWNSLAVRLLAVVEALGLRFDRKAPEDLTAERERQAQKPSSGARSAATGAPRKTKVFVSYSRKDEQCKGQVVAHLESVSVSGIGAWHDGLLEPGSEWRRDLEEALETCELAILLISADFLSSDFIQNDEMPRLLKRSRDDGIRLVPLLVRPCNWQTKPWLERLTISPRGATPLSLMESGEAEAEVSALVGRIVDVLLAREPQDSRDRRQPATGDSAEGEDATPGARRSARSGSVDVYLANLPSTSQRLFGRHQELAMLDDALGRRNGFEGVEILVLVARGGTGKTALVNRWLDDLKRSSWGGANRVFGWSFYSQGSADDRLATDIEFLNSALERFGIPAGPGMSAYDKGVLLADAIRQTRTLLVLDGCEPLQHPPSPPRQGRAEGGVASRTREGGRFRALGLRALLRQLARAGHPGLVVVTTREPLTDLADTTRSAENPSGSVRRRSLADLAPEDGARLLHALGCNRAGEERIGPDHPELIAASHEARGHALTLNLLGRYLREAEYGDIRRRGTADILAADEALGGHAHRVMVSYERWLAQAGDPAPGTENLLVAVLRLLAFFDRPADEGAIRALLKAPAIPGLTDTLSKLSRSDWRMAVSRLVDLGWVERSGGPQTASGLDVDDPPVADDPKGGTWLDTHPLIRSYLATQVKESRPDAWREGHRRLFEHFSFRAAGVHLPSDIAGLQPLYRAMAHACRAGLHQRALKEVYVPRILRGTDLTGFFVTKKLGAFEDDLQGIACFFEDPWERVSPLLSIGDQAFLLGVASHDLQALRRFEEAEGPMRSALDVYLRQAGVPDEQWRANYLRSAAIMANQLSDLNLTLGRLADARADIEQCVDLAKRSGDSFLSEVALTSLGDVLHQQGDFDGAWKAFAEAEAERDAVHPRMSILISLQGYEYCDLILAGAERTAWRLFLSPQREGVSAAEIEEEVAACAEVARRCRLIRRWRETGEWNPESVGAIDIAVEQLGLGRALLLRLLLEPTLPRTDDPRWAGARAELAKALDTFRSGHENHLPSALLPIAWLSTATGDLAAARRALDEAWETVTQPGMRLQMVDTLLYRARLNRDSADLVKARSLIDDLQYGRRRQELADSETFARAW